MGRSRPLFLISLQKALSASDGAFLWGNLNTKIFLFTKSQRFALNAYIRCMKTSFLLFLLIGSVLASCTPETTTATAPPDTTPTVLLDKAYFVPPPGSTPKVFTRTQTIDVGNVAYPVTAIVSAVLDAEGCYKMTHLRVEHNGATQGLTITQVRDTSLYDCGPTGRQTPPLAVGCHLVKLYYKAQKEPSHGTGDLLVYSDGSDGYETPPPTRK